MTTTTQPTRFPADFVWGTATAAYQIEGAVAEDGRAPSIWDTKCLQPGAIKNNDSGERAADHYHRYQEDVAIMRSLNLNAYRFSLSWSRLIPDGEGALNPKGVAFYDRLIDELLAAGITPWVTCYHWDLPQALEDNYGGWKNKDVSKLLGDFARRAAELYSDRVKHWITTNEIHVFTGQGSQGLQVVHNALLGHGHALAGLRAGAKQPLTAGFAEAVWSEHPVYDTPEHLAAASRAFKYSNARITFPIFEGKYSPEYFEQYKENLPDYTDAEMKLIGAPVDFAGYNIYSGSVVRAAANPRGYEVIEFPAGYPKNQLGWNIAPRSIYSLIKHSKDHFGNVPVYITENGMPASDKEQPNGEVLDIDRVEFLREHLAHVQRASADGLPIKGYFHWSFMDNFEWLEGYSARFGVVRTNYRTMDRTIKLSGHYYRDVIQAGRVL